MCCRLANNSSLNPIKSSLEPVGGRNNNTLPFTMRWRGCLIPHVPRLLAAPSPLPSSFYPPGRLAKPHSPSIAPMPFCFAVHLSFFLALPPPYPFSFAPFRTFATPSRPRSAPLSLLSLVRLESPALFSLFLAGWLARPIQHRVLRQRYARLRAAPERTIKR